MAPLDRRSQRLLTRLGVPTALEQVEPLGEAREDLRRGEDARPGCGQLERERQLVQAPAELGDRLVRLELRARAEELDSVRLGQRGHRVIDLAADAKELAARDQQLQVGAPLEQLAQVRRRLDHLLEVVEQEHELPLFDVLGEALLGAQCLRDRLHHERRLAQRGERDPEDPRLERGHELCGRLERKPRLAGATRPGERQEPRTVPEQADKLIALPPSADEGGDRPRQVGVRDRLQRREALGAELEERDRLVEVLQPVLAELGQLTIDERARRGRDDDLSAVPRGGDAGSPVELTPGIALARQARLSGVQAHPDPDRP